MASIRGCDRRTSSSSSLLDLLDEALVLLVEHADIALESVGFPLHVTIDLGPLVLLLANKLVFFTN